MFKSDTDFSWYRNRNHYFQKKKKKCEELVLTLIPLINIKKKKKKFCLLFQSVCILDHYPMN